MNLSFFDSSFVAIYHVNRIYFPFTRETGLVDAGALHGNSDTVDLEGKSELEVGVLITRVWEPYVALP